MARVGMQLIFARSKSLDHEIYIPYHGTQKLVVLVVMLMRQGAFQEMACVVAAARVSQVAGMRRTLTETYSSQKSRMLVKRLDVGSTME